MDKNLLYLLIGLIGSLFAGYKYNLWQRAKLALQLLKQKDDKEVTIIINDLKALNDQISDVDKEREDLKKKYENES